MSTKIILAGIGGQGVLFAHRVLADCAIAQGLDVTGSETHGMSQRGGSVVSHLKIGDSSAPMIRQGTADVLLAFDATEAYRSLAFVRRGGQALVNTALANFPNATVREFLARQQIGVRVLDAHHIAHELGRASIANVALLGFASAWNAFPFSPNALKETIARITPARFVELNARAFEEGMEAARENTQVEIGKNEAV